jgi:hypothetical protein
VLGPCTPTAAVTACGLRLPVFWAFAMGDADEDFATATTDTGD